MIPFQHEREANTISDRWQGMGPAVAQDDDKMEGVHCSWLVGSFFAKKWRWEERG